MLVLFSAGNSGSGLGTVGAPASAKKYQTIASSQLFYSVTPLVSVLAVGASETTPEGWGSCKSDEKSAERVASFSSRGPADGNRIKPGMCTYCHFWQSLIQLHKMSWRQDIRHTAPEDNRAVFVFPSSFTWRLTNSFSHLSLIMEHRWPHQQLQEQQRSSDNTSHHLPLGEHSHLLQSQLLTDNILHPDSASPTPVEHSLKPC